MRRRWSPRDRRQQISEPIGRFLESGQLADGGLFDAFDLGRTAGRLRATWQECGAAVTAAWLRKHPGSRPWAWWRWDAPEPRRCVVGVELLMPKQSPAGWEFVWRDHFGVPAFVQCRPRGYGGLPAVEGEGAYLRRLGLLAPHERPAPATLAPEAVDPFLTYQDELEDLRVERSQRGARTNIPVATNGGGDNDGRSVTADRPSRNVPKKEGGLHEQ